mgnify:CR=1 FL=1
MVVFTLISLLAIPLKNGYEGTRLKECESGRGMEPVHCAVYRDFREAKDRYFASSDDSPLTRHQRERFWDL